MKSGPTYVFACPQCHSLFQRGTIISCNTFKARFYSDGTTDSTYTEPCPAITKCRNCNHIFWIEKAVLIGEMDFNNPPLFEIDEIWEPQEYFKRRRERFKKEWYQSPRSELLGLEDLYYLLNTMFYKIPDEELYIRKHIWWLENNEEKKEYPVQRTVFETQRRILNMQHLARLLDNKPTFNIDGLLKAEIYRQLGEYDRCLQILESIKQPESISIITQLKEACAHKSSKMFIFTTKMN